MTDNMINQPYEGVLQAPARKLEADEDQKNWDHEVALQMNEDREEREKFRRSGKEKFVRGLGS